MSLLQRLNRDLTSIVDRYLFESGYRQVLNEMERMTVPFLLMNPGIDYGEYTYVCYGKHIGWSIGYPLS